MAGAKTDGMLLNRALPVVVLADRSAVVETLGRAGILKTVSTGATAFPVDQPSPLAALRVQTRV